MDHERVLRRLPAKVNPRARVLCFHHAGGTAYEFRRWESHLSQGVEVCAVQLPGRDERINDPPLRTLEHLLAEVLPAIKSVTDRPYVMFGHSMGAIVAFETARSLRRAALPQPSHLFVSARRAPQLRGAGESSRLLNDAAFIRQIRRYGGLPAEIEQSPLLELCLPTLRADVEVIESYEHREEAPLECPLTACGGASDADGNATLMTGWREHTSASFELRMFPGGHFYIRQREARVLQLVADALRHVL
jgi:medium-chain acyl-[acyl-carrier-protein] hydrolase